MRVGSDTTHYFRDSCMLLTRVPESAVFLPYVTCRDDVVRGFTDRMIGPGGLIPLVEHVEFESIELNHRYRIGAFTGTAQDRLRQLFSPTLIDWMASTAPDGLYFELFSGMLQMTVTTGKVTDHAQLNRVCELATHIVERIRAESAETMARRRRARVHGPAEQAEYEQQAGRHAGGRRVHLAARRFQGGARPRSSRSVKGKSKGLLRKVFKSIDRGEAAEPGTRGSVPRLWRAPRPRLAAAHRLHRPPRRPPLPIAPKQALRGPLPGLGVEGDLFVLVGAGCPGIARAHRGRAAGLRPGATLVASPRGASDDERMTIGGFQLAATGGGRRVSEQSRRDAEAAAALAE